jgi:beta-aspartyl-peptidase (threonine type)
MRVVMAKFAVDHMAYENAAIAAQRTVRHLSDKVAGLGGIITIDHNGGIGHAHNTPRMAFAYMNEALRDPVEGI